MTMHADRNDADVPQGRHRRARRSPGTSEVPDEYARRLGRRLRQIRQQKGLSLTAVEARTGEEFKASVLGAYERGERSLSVTRLMRLAECYGVPLDQLLPGGSASGVEAEPTTVPVTMAPLRMDLARISRLGGAEGELVRRQLGLLQLSRQDFNGRVMSLRRDDERVMAAIFGVREESIRAHLAELGLIIEQ